MPGSGALPGLPGDVSLRNALGELKFTTHRSFKLKLSDLRKIETAAASQGRAPFFAVDFREGRQVTGETWIAFPAAVARRLLALL